MAYYAIDSRRNWQRTYGDYRTVTLYLFGSRAARDAWVNADFSREALTARTANYIRPYFKAIKPPPAPTHTSPAGQ